MELLFAEAMDPSSVIVEFGKCLWEPLKRHTGYLLFYRRNIKKLETQVEKLEKARGDVQQDVDVALRRGETVRNTVQQWLDNVDTLKSETESMVARLAGTKCWKGWRWNPVLCHGLGKKAAEKILAVDELESKSNFERVSHPPPPLTVESLLPTSGFQALASTEMPMKSVLNALQDEKIQIIGVHGMGGVGKTTLMREVAKQVAREKLFDEVVMVTVSQNVMIEEIQQKIGAGLGLEFKVDDVSVRAAMLSRRLKQVKKLLLILDDLWHWLDLNTVGIPCGEEHNGFKIAITSRRSEVCNMMKSQKNIPVMVLSEDDSWKLFEANAGPVANSPELFDVARNIVKECKGLPLAIVVLGRALTNERVANVWNVVLNKLKQSIPTDIEGLEKEVFHSIKFSFAYLQSNEAKLCFLFCCLFPEDDYIQYIQVTRLMAGEGKIENIQTLDDAENQVRFLLDKLKASGLLLEGGNEECVQMHDIVRDVAVWIASDMTYGFYSRAGAGLKEWPRSMNMMEEHQRISLMQNDIRALPEEPLFFPNLRTLLLNRNYNLSRIPEAFFSEMKALQVLDLSHTKISSLPTSMSCLTNLRALNLSWCQSLENLSGLRELSNLRYLCLSHTHCIIPRNVISQLSNLEELQIDIGFDEWQVQGSEDASCASFAELACLSRLRTLCINVGDERCFLEDLGPGAFENLVNFWIWPRRYELGLNVKENWFAIFTLAVPNWAKPLLLKTENLLLQRCPGMECLLGAEGVSVLNIAFSNIKRMYLVEMTDLEELCRGAPPDDRFLSKMRVLKVVNCHKLTKIFSSELFLRSGLEQLKRLKLDSLPQLISIWDGDMPLTRLRRLYVGRCEKLTSLFSWKQAQRLECLEELYVSKCPDMVAIIMSEKENPEERAIGDNTSALPQLRDLQLRNLKITAFDTGGALFDWPSLNILTIVKCPNLKRLPLNPNGGLKLDMIQGSEEWFQALKWDDESIKLRLETVFINEDEDDDYNYDDDDYEYDDDDDEEEVPWIKKL